MPRVTLENDQTALLLPVTSIIPGKNTRTQWDRIDARLKQLAASIQEHGILEPLLVRELRTRSSVSGRVFELVAGFRRYTAAKYLEMDRVPVRVLATSDEETLAANLAENLSREDLTDADALRGVEVLQDTYSWGVRKIARATGRSAGWISELLAVARSKRERSAVESGKIAVGTAARMVRLTGELSDVRDALLRRIEAGERVQLDEVPRVRHLQSVVAEQAAADAEVAAMGGIYDEDGQIRPGLPPRILQLGLQERSLARNMRLIVRQVLSTISAVWNEQGREHVLPREIRDELTRTCEELTEFLSREPKRGERAAPRG